jgi:hypothetical protein
MIGSESFLERLISRGCDSCGNIRGYQSIVDASGTKGVRVGFWNSTVPLKKNIDETVG